MSCYSCKKSLIDGVPNTDVEDPDQPNCSEKKMCPAGTTSCISGNMVTEWGGKTIENVYYKDCGSVFDGESCGGIQKAIEYAGLEESVSAELKRCNLKKCDGNMCNDESAEEIENYGWYHCQHCELQIYLLT